MRDDDADASEFLRFHPQFDFSRFLGYAAGAARRGEPPSTLHAEYLGRFADIEACCLEAESIIADPAWKRVFVHIRHVANRAIETVPGRSPTDHWTYLRFLADVYNRCHGKRRRSDRFLGGEEKHLLETLRKHPPSSDPELELALSPILDLIREQLAFTERVRVGSS